jgi:hypothetical protein
MKREFFSPLAGEMAAKRPEAVISEGTAIWASRVAAATSPGRPSSGHPPLKGEGNAGATS